MDYPTLGKELPRREATCSKCGAVKMPTRAYLALCKHYNEPYVCKACRANTPDPPMSLGMLGYL